MQSATATDFLDAVKIGDVSLVEQLIENDRSLLHARNEQGVTPLLVAAYYGQTHVAAALFCHSPEMDIFEAAALGGDERVAELLDGRPTLATTHSNDGFTALTLAALFGKPRVLELLIDRGADVNAVSTNAIQERPIFAALSYYRPDTSLRMLLHLLRHGADVNATRVDGETPLHLAAALGRGEQVILLLERGAEPTARDASGKVPLDLAAANGHPTILEILGKG